MKTKEELTSKELEQVTGGNGGELKNRVIGLLKATLGLANIEVDGKSSIVDDLGADSLDVVDIVSTVEDEFSISIPDSLAISIRTVDDLCKVIEESKG